MEGTNLEVDEGLDIEALADPQEPTRGTLGEGITTREWSANSHESNKE